MKQKRNWGKEIKDVGTLILVVGALFIAIIFGGIFSSSSSSYEQQPFISQFVDDNIFFLAVGGLFLLLIGIIVRSVGKSKEAKYNADNDKK